ncbi:MAG TPA: thioredoxin family protein [Bdellovibrionota bacterium]|jgi:thioredoxin-like negative regulator of GroEL|nr:thioredoxin family protein [Bdellovibrionota bacterium]
MSQILELNDANFQQNVADKDLAIVDIYASWCGSCRLFYKIFEEVSREQAELAYFKIDGDDNESFREGIDVTNLPFVAAFHKGKYLGGLSTAKKEGLVKFIERMKEQVQ